jgi:hypothetical protein
MKLTFFDIFADKGHNGGPEKVYIIDNITKGLFPDICQRNSENYDNRNFRLLAVPNIVKGQ